MGFSAGVMAGLAAEPGSFTALAASAAILTAKACQTAHVAVTLPYRSVMTNRMALLVLALECVTCVVMLLNQLQPSPDERKRNDVSDDARYYSLDLKRSLRQATYAGVLSFAPCMRSACMSGAVVRGPSQLTSVTAHDLLAHPHECTHLSLQIATCIFQCAYDLQDILLWVQSLAVIFPLIQNMVLLCFAIYNIGHMAADALRARKSLLLQVARLAELAQLADKMADGGRWMMSILSKVQAAHGRSHGHTSAAGGRTAAGTFSAQQVQQAIRILIETAKVRCLDDVLTVLPNKC